MGRWRGVLATVIPVGAFLLLAVVLSGQRDAVDWSRQRAVVFQSDDWGLAGFVPSAAVWDHLDRDALSPGRFPAVYWNSTLEDSAAVARLCRLLGGHRGRDGLPAVLQPNYVLSSLAPGREPGSWQRYDLPASPPHYERPGLWEAVADGVAAGCWYPEYHAVWHYDPARRREATAADPSVEEASRRGVILFPGGEQARELGPWRDTAELAAELDEGLQIFSRAFGRKPGSIIAPDYTWDERIESLWASRGLVVIQGKREQRNPSFGHGRVGRVLKYADRQWSRVARPGRIYIERNCRFEPVQFPDPRAVVNDCLDEIVAAWEQGEPAVVETHRINFAHAESAVAETGRAALADLLAGIDELAGAKPVFMTDTEVAQLRRRGASWCVRGGLIVVRNAAAGARLVTVPVEAQNLAAAQAGIEIGDLSALPVILGPGESEELHPGQHFGAPTSHR